MPELTRLWLSLVSYDEVTSLGCLAHQRNALVVDLTACVRDLRLVDKPMLMIIGDLEPFDVSQRGPHPPGLTLTMTWFPSCCAPLQSSQLPAALDTVTNLIEDLVLRAHLVRRCDGLDFQVWDQAARTESAARQQQQQQ